MVARTKKSGACPVGQVQDLRNKKTYGYQVASRVLGALTNFVYTPPPPQLYISLAECAPGRTPKAFSLCSSCFPFWVSLGQLPHLLSRGCEGGLGVERLYICSCAERFFCFNRLIEEFQENWP